MIDSGDPRTDERVLLFAPAATDASLTRTVVTDAGLTWLACSSSEEISREIETGAGILVVSEEGFAGQETDALVDALRQQPSWSDLPVVFLATARGNSPRALAALELLGNVTVLERPLRAATFRSALRAALRARRRQYELRDRLEALRESEARFRTLADSAPVLIWVNGLDGCDFVNREYLEFIGRRFEDIQGRGWTRALHPDDADQYLRAYVDAFERRGRFEAPCRLLRADGEYRWMKSVGMPRFTPEGTLLGYVGCSLDVTDLKLYGDALEAADRQKDEFLATLAHELRNPLAPIRNALHVVRRAGDDPSTRDRVVSIMERQVNHLVRLVDDLLEVSRLSLGRFELRKARVELSTVVHSAVEASRPHLEAAEHELVFDLPHEPVVLEADPVRLAQVLGNLLNNAARYTEPGGLISLAARCEPPADVVFTVRDTGAGIPAEMLLRIFDMFTRVEQPAGHVAHGLGIGLTLVKRLVDLHGGTVEARSDGPGRGSEFIVRLPIVAAGAEPAVAKEAGLDAASAPRPNARRILVIDDNVDSAVSLAMVLRSMGHEVHLAHDGYRGIEIVRAHHPDVVLVDIAMPGMDGYEVARRLRADPDAELGLLVALSGYGQEEHRRRSRAAGFDDHLVKPADLTTLEGLLAAEQWSTARGRTSS